MVQGQFGAILEELGTVLGMKLEPDAHNSCMIKYQNGLTLQMDHDAGREQIIALLKIGTPTAGVYRENVLREALKANGLATRQPGVFAFSKKADCLVLYDTISMKDLTGRKLSEFLAPLVVRAQEWYAALGRGDIPSYTGAAPTGGGASGMFGM